eukprot:scaffold2253_cov119-Cylindrotheca_fusiformis.AAC.10
MEGIFLGASSIIIPHSYSYLWHCRVFDIRACQLLAISDLWTLFCSIGERSLSNHQLLSIDLRLDCLNFGHHKDRIGWEQINRQLTTARTKSRNCSWLCCTKCRMEKRKDVKGNCQTQRLRFCYCL